MVNRKELGGAGGRRLNLGIELGEDPGDKSCRALYDIMYNCSCLGC